MDEDEYRSAYQDVNPTRCAFEKAILTRTVNCSCADVFCLAERYGVACKRQTSQRQCFDVLRILRQKSSFALGLRSPEERLPHSKEMKVQIGGLRGLIQSTHGANVSTNEIEDINALVSASIDKFEGVESIPFGDVVQSVVRYQIRKRRR